MSGKLTKAQGAALQYLADNGEARWWPAGVPSSRQTRKALLARGLTAERVDRMMVATSITPAGRLALNPSVEKKR